MNTYYFVADWIENYYTTIKDCLFSTYNIKLESTRVMRESEWTGLRKSLDH